MVLLGVACGESDDTPTPHKPTGGSGGKSGAPGGSGEAGEGLHPGAGKGGTTSKGGTTGKGGTAGKGGSSARGGSSTTGGTSGEAGSDAGGTHGGTGGTRTGGAGGSGGTSTAGEAGYGGGGDGGELAGLVHDFIDAEWGALCHAMFTCVQRSGDDIANVALLGTEQRCTDLLTTTRSLNLGGDDLAARVQAGTVTFLPGKVAACLAAVSSCGVVGSVPLTTKACRDVFEGAVPLGQSCERSEQCAGDAVCAVVDTCPGTCAARPGLDAPCDSTSDCDTDGTVVCDRRVLDVDGKGACHEPVVHDAANEGDACDRSPNATLEFTPCAAGLFCDGADDDGTGLCHAPLAADAACDFDGDVCVNGHWCLDQVSCKAYTIAREVGATCNPDELVYCDPIAQLTCDAGACALIGDGHEGSNCNGLDLSEFHTCDPELNCASQGEGGMGPIETCEAPHPGSQPCDNDRDCASGSCQPDGTCATDYCETPGY